MRLQYRVASLCNQLLPLFLSPVNWKLCTDVTNALFEDKKIIYDKKIVFELDILKKKKKKGLQYWVAILCN